MALCGTPCRQLWRCCWRCPWSWERLGTTESHRRIQEAMPPWSTSTTRASHEHSMNVCQYMSSYFFCIQLLCHTPVRMVHHGTVLSVWRSWTWPFDSLAIRSATAFKHLTLTAQGTKERAFAFCRNTSIIFNLLQYIQKHTSYPSHILDSNV